MLLFTSAVSAQSDDPETFPVEQRCIGAPTQPPDDWTYPGMILMSGYAGIHAMQADWETPHMVAQFTMDGDGNVPIHGGQLSPNGNWYAVPMGEVTWEQSFNNYWNVRGLRLFNLSDATQSFTLDMNDYTDIYMFYETAWGFYPVEWMDDRSLIIGGLLIYPFDHRAETSRLEFGDDFNLPRIVSPDLTRAYGGSTPYLSQYQAGLHDLINLKTIAVPGELSYVSWQPDSSGFMGQFQEDSRDWRGLAYFDRNGQLIDQIIAFDAGSYDDRRLVSGRSEFQWSPDGRYYALVPIQSPELKNLYLADVQERIVMDTCVIVLTAPVWSPDGTMFAYLANASENLNLIVVDTITWQAYIVARHSGTRGRFGEPEMVGWRDTNEAQ